MLTHARALQATLAYEGMMTHVSNVTRVVAGEREIAAKKMKVVTDENAQLKVRPRSPQHAVAIPQHA